MSRPPLLIIDPNADRRTGLSRGLAAEGYEVVPTGGGPEGLRFAQSLDSAVLVADADLPEVTDGSLIQAAGPGTAVVLLGTPQGESALASDISFIPTGDGVALDDLCRKLRLVLIGRELEVDADSRCEALVGDLSLTPFSELLRGLGDAGFSGRLELGRGWVHLALGEVTASAAPPTTGLKAFCRLSRLSSGSFRIVPGERADTGTGENRREMSDDLGSLMVAAIEDSMGEFPDAHTRVSIEIGADFFSQEMTPTEQRIVQVAQKGASLQEVLDAGSEPDGAVMDHLLRLAERGIAVLRPPEPAVVVISDSTADLPAHIAAEHGIRVVPLKVHFGDKTYRDGVNLEPRHFYELLEKKEHHPSSEPPDANEFGEAFLKPLEQGDIVSIHLSSGLSATLENAAAAAKTQLDGAQRPDARIEVVDSRAVSMGLGWQALFAARMASRGEGVAAIRRRLDEIAPRVQMFFIVDTIDYLVRGGRIGKAQGMIGKLLGIKPILGVKDGEVVAVDRVRGGRAAQKRLIELLGERMEHGRSFVASVVHAKAPPRADRVGRLLREHFNVSELIIAEMGPVVGTHVGPGTVGVMGFQPRDDDEAALLAPLSPGRAPSS